MDDDGDTDDTTEMIIKKKKKLSTQPTNMVSGLSTELKGLFLLNIAGKDDDNDDTREKKKTYQELKPTNMTVSKLNTTQISIFFFFDVVGKDDEKDEATEITTILKIQPANMDGLETQH